MAYLQINDTITLFYEEFGSGEHYILSAQAVFYKKGMQQALAEEGYHLYCITIRGFHPSTLVTEDYGTEWYNIFADDVVAFADKMGIDKFIYMGASHGAGTGWHLMLRHPERVEAFVAVVAGPHSLKEGTMSYRQMLEQGIIKEVPTFDPEIDDDAARTLRRKRRADHIAALPPAPVQERNVDYGRPLMALKTEERLCEALKTITTPTLLIGGIDDPIATPELLTRTARCLPHCKLVIYSNCGHNIDTDLIEETVDETVRFLKTVRETGRVYKPVIEE